jgi:hypothetical protein
MGLKTTTYVGVADAHGIESFHEKDQTNDFDRQCRVMRADSNRQRHAVYYEVDLDKAAFKVVNAHLEDGNCALALEWLKRLSTELRSLPHHAESWELIPNVNLDPYAS